jgi:S-DNA-T family DNA segregation ATPase FtsK/SpoIIIE
MGFVLVVVLFFFLWPLWIVWKVSRRLILAVPVYSYFGLALLIGFHDAQAIAVYVAIALVVWRFAHRETFDKYIARWFRASWRRWRVYDKRWKMAMKRLYLTDQVHWRTIYPKIERVKCSIIEDKVRVRMLTGHDDADYRHYASNLANAFGSKVCHVVDAGPRKIWLVFPRGDTLRSVVPAIPIPEKPDLENVEIGIYEDGSPMCIGIRGTHYYVGGSTGSGKGSIIDSTIRNLAAGIRDGWIDLCLCDPKGGMQLKPYLPMAKEYASRFEEMAKIIHRVAERMQARAEELSDRGIRLHTPSVEFPQVLLIIDEMAALTLYLKETNLALSKQLVGDLGLILTEGRAVGFSIMACAQDPRKEVNSLRNLFPGRLGLQFDEEGDVGTAMGKGAVEKGALCHLIPKNPKRYSDWAGIGYELYEGGTVARKFRTAYPTDSDIDFMVAEYAIKKQITERARSTA